MMFADYGVLVDTNVSKGKLKTLERSFEEKSIENK